MDADRRRAERQRLIRRARKLMKLIGKEIQRFEPHEVDDATYAAAVAKAIDLEFTLTTVLRQLRILL